MWNRKPAYAGSFYPGDKHELDSSIKEYLSDADDGGVNSSSCVISPHAGYVYSGPVAAYSYNALDKESEVVIVLAPSHRVRIDGASIIPEGIYSTPLGDVEIDLQIGSELIKDKSINFYKEAHSQEHSLEVQVPFLQYVLDEFKIVPIVIGTTDFKICSEIAVAIAEIMKKETRKVSLVISTDLSHFHSYDSAVSIDKKIVDAVGKFDLELVVSLLNAGEAEACGEGPIIIGMMVMKKLGASEIKILKYANSGDTAGDKSRVVGYMAAAFV